ncbi:MAG: hypothetical protein SW833_21905 [Cyanobacteriota bacterium]|nr:hypothetical protein [Cyanobacteriota bacterium]
MTLEHERTSEFSAVVSICPGFHPSELTDSFVRSVTISTSHFRIVPIQYYPPYSGKDIFKFLSNSVSITTPLIFIAFSAGVVGAIAAAREWQRRGSEVRALIALDGWGVPLLGDFPIHRLSHDGFTHWSSQALGGGEEGFYADPSVEHLALWRSPQTVWGWRERGMGLRDRTTAAEFINQLWQRYG